MSLRAHETVQCRACRSYVPAMSMFCMLCGAGMEGRRRGGSSDPRAVLYWAARELGLPREILRTIVLLAPRGLNAHEARWMPYHPKLAPRGPKGHALVHPGKGDPYESFDAFPAMWNRPLPAGWGVTRFSVFLASRVCLMESQYMVGVCFPSSFEQAGRCEFILGQSCFSDEHGPLPGYPTKCFALLIGGPPQAVHVIDDGTTVVPISDDLSADLVGEEADRVLVTASIDTGALTAMFYINSTPVRQDPFPVPQEYAVRNSYPFVCLNTVGDRVEWIE